MSLETFERCDRVQRLSRATDKSLFFKSIKKSSSFIEFNLVEEKFPRPKFH